MICVILAGGEGSRISEETYNKPKALVEIGNRPILGYIADIFKRQGVSDFLILGGYKFGVLLDRFMMSELEYKGSNDNSYFFSSGCNSYTLVDTGTDALSFDRLSAVRDMLTERFLLTYCDCLCSVDIKRLIKAHDESGALVTLTAVLPEPRYGVLDIGDNGRVVAMREKDKADMPWINGGYMVVEPGIFDYIKDEKQSLERDVLTKVACDGRLFAYKHEGFWQCMDTLREKQLLCKMYESGKFSEIFCKCGVGI